MGFRWVIEGIRSAIPGSPPSRYPNFKVTVQMATKDQGAAGRQVLRTTKLLEDAGFQAVNTDTDSPTPEGWIFAATYASPAHGNFSKLTELAATKH